MTREKNNLFRDLGIIILSFLIALILVKTGSLSNLINDFERWQYLGSFLAGIFFVSIFTVAPAAVALAGIAKNNSVLLTALLGGLGGLVGDYLLFRFVKNRLGADILSLVKHHPAKRLKEIFKLKIFHWLVPLIGALIIASPLPDELGLVLMGLNKMKNRNFIILSFTLNFLGILIIGLIAKNIN